MLTALSLVVLLAEGGQASLPRTPDPQVAQKSADREQTTDPWFDRSLEATEDSSFVRVAIKSVRQGVIDARAEPAGLSRPDLRAAAGKIGASFVVNQSTQHQNVLKRFRAQIAGQGDGQRKRELRAALPGCQKNLQMLLALKL